MSADITSKKELAHLLARVLCRFDGDSDADDAELYDDVNEAYRKLSGDDGDGQEGSAQVRT